MSQLTIAGAWYEALFFDEPCFRAAFRLFQPSGRVFTHDGFELDSLPAILRLIFPGIAAAAAAADDAYFRRLLVRENAGRPFSQRMRHEDGTKANLALDQCHRLLQLPALILLVTATDDATSPLFVAGTTARARRPLAPATYLTLYK